MRQLFEVSSEGGAARALGDATGRVASPHLLPGDTAVLYTAYQKNWTSGDERVMALPLTPGGTPKVLVPEAADARYLPTGHLAFLRQGTLVVAPFDVKTLTLAGDEVPVLKNVAQTVATWNAMDLTLAGQWAVSAAGTLAYVANPTPSFPGSELVAVDRAGHVTPLGAPVNTYREHIEPSPDGSRVVMSIQTEKEVGLSVYDVARGALTPLLAAPDNSETIQPIWSKRGRIAAMVIKGGTTELVLFDAHSPSNLEVVANSAYFSPGSWSPDGQSLIGVLAGDIWVYSGTAQEQQLAPLTQTPANEAFPALSPDGRWLAYTSNASGREEVYVQPYPGPGKAIQVSSAGGRSPAWNPQGGELFYAELPQAGGPDWRLKQAAGPDWQMMSVDMTVPGSPGKPKALFAYQPASLPLASCSPINCYSVAPNGRQFYTQRMLPRAPAPVTHIRLVRNWLEEVKAKAPAK